MKSNPKQKAVYLALCILAAIVVWIFVDNFGNNGGAVMHTKWFRDVPITYTGETVLTERGFMLLDEDTVSTVDLEMEGTAFDLALLDKDYIRVTVDLSNVSRTGVQTVTSVIYGYTEEYFRQNITVSDRTPSVITINVAELYHKTVDVRCEISGNVAEGYSAGELQVSPTEIEVRGDQEDVDAVSYAKVTLDISGADRTVVQALEWELYDYNDIKIDNPAVRSKVKTVQATLPVKTSKEVDLVVNFVPAAGSTLDTMQYTVSPDKVTLVGEKDVLDTIDAIVLDTLYLQDLQPSQSLTYSVTAPEGTTLAENVGPVTVTIVVTGVTERNVTVTSFNCENVPEGFSAVPVTESLNILLRGLESEMAQITAEDLRITVDLSGITEPGVHTVPVTVQVANYANVGVKGSYQIVVDVERLP